MKGKGNGNFKILMHVNNLYILNTHSSTVTFLFFKVTSKIIAGKPLYTALWGVETKQKKSNSVHKKLYL